MLGAPDWTAGRLTVHVTRGDQIVVFDSTCQHVSVVVSVFPE